MKNKDFRAFPSVHDDGSERTVHFGISARDYFAAKAMASLINQPGFTYYNIARMAYELADAMLEQRVK
jgi:hypothetical protein